MRDENPLDWFGRKRAEFGQFDLGALTALGWLVFLSSLAVVVVVSLLLADRVVAAGPGPRNEPRKPWWMVPAAAGILLLAIGWFHLWKWLLGLVGVPVYRASRGGRGEEGESGGHV